jgi:hypothetical protein
MQVAGAMLAAMDPCSAGQPLCAHQACLCMSSCHHDMCLHWTALPCYVPPSPGTQICQWLMNKSTRLTSSRRTCALAQMQCVVPSRQCWCG